MDFDLVLKVSMMIFICGIFNWNCATALSILQKL